MMRRSLRHTANRYMIPARSESARSGLQLHHEGKSIGANLGVPNESVRVDATLVHVRSIRPAGGNVAAAIPRVHARRSEVVMVLCDLSAVHGRLQRDRVRALRNRQTSRDQKPAENFRTDPAYLQHARRLAWCPFGSTLVPPQNVEDQLSTGFLADRRRPPDDDCVRVLVWMADCRDSKRYRNLITPEYRSRSFRERLSDGNPDPEPGTSTSRD